MGDSELSELASNIKEKGLLRPIILYKRKILDGRNRYHALKLIGHDFEGNDFDTIGEDGDYEADYYFPNGISALDYVLANNLHRRHLTAEQKRAVIAAVLKDQPKQSNRQAAAKAGTDHKTVAKVREELEGRGEIPHVEKRADTKGREQPAKRTETAQKMDRTSEAKKDSVTAEASRNEEAPEKRIAWLEKANKELRKEVKSLKSLYREAAAMRDQLLKDWEPRRDNTEKDRLAKEKAQLYIEVLRLNTEKQQLELEAILKPPILKKWFADLSKRFHPDRGGSDLEMKVVNEAHQLLLAMLKPS
jgi:hypothetical protein